MRKTIMLAALALLLPTVSQASSLEDLLVEKGVITSSEAQASSHDGASKVYWQDGTRLDFADTGFTVKINTLLQNRYTFTDMDTGSDNTSSFDVNIARLIVSGTALHSEFDYRLEVDFQGEDGAELLDAYLTWHACDNASLRMGQMKTGISRQFNTDESRLQFADRSFVSDFYDLGRQSGLKAVTGLMDDQLYLSAGIFNGRSDGEGINRGGVDTNHTGVVAARMDLMGTMDAFEEGDIDHTEDGALNMGVAYAYSDANNQIGPVLDDTELQSANIDLNYKYDGMSFHGEFYWQDFEGDTTNIDTDSNGFYAQFGYFLKSNWELAARYGLRDCDDGNQFGDCAGNDDISEIAASVNYFWWKHNLKAQMGWSRATEDPLDGSDIDTDRWLLQLSSYF